MGIEMRESVERFAKAMDAKLNVHEYKEGWDTCSEWYLLDRLLDEFMELRNALHHCGPGDGDIKSECCDVANFAMMIFDNASNGVPGFQGELRSG